MIVYTTMFRDFGIRIWNKIEKNLAQKIIAALISSSRPTKSGHWPY
jgi:hypothetical protein